MGAVVIVLSDGETYVFGPFPDGDAATRWGFHNCKEFEWFWDRLNSPTLPLSAALKVNDNKERK